MSELNFIREWCKCFLPGGFSPLYCGSKYYCYQVRNGPHESVIRIDDDYYLFSSATARAMSRQLAKFRTSGKGALFK